MSPLSRDNSQHQNIDPILPPGRKPSWLKSKATFGPEYLKVKRTLAACSLHSVCEEANCPNMRECFSAGTATFMILGNMCTRGCRFCDVATGVPSGLDLDEPRRLAESVAQLDLKHVVVTSVTRDDLPDGGAAVFVEAINRLRLGNPPVKIEVLIPDFAGNNEALRAVLDSAPDVLNHNIVTVSRLYPCVRPCADYARSLGILRMAAIHPGRLCVKSGIMAGLGESWDELLKTMQDIRQTGCRILTIGQYLSPSAEHLPVERYYLPEEFSELARLGKAMGFGHVESGPLVRSSYKAFEQAASANHNANAQGTSVHKI